MLPEEAELMGRWVLALGLPPGSTCLNIGSSTRRFREEVQPYIADRLFRPAERAGLRVVHCDLKEADGVDEVGDVLDPAVQRRLRDHRADLLICSNLLEHLTDPERFAGACGSLVRPGGHALLTVPLSFPYHPDPIDTMLRLRAPELSAMLPGWEVVRSAEVEAGTYWRELRGGPRPLLALGRRLARVALPIHKPREWLPAAHQLLWLFKPYRGTLVLLRRPDDGGARPS